MRHYEWFQPTHDGTRLFMQSWEPDAETGGVVALLHGHGDHSGRYAHVAAALAAAGFATVSFDHRGHGKSAGRRGYTPSYDALLVDIDTLLAETERRYANRPRFLYGQSMGGNLALNYALRRRPALAGVIATSPWLRLALTPPAWKVRAGNLLDRVAPTLAQPSGLDTAAIARDPAAVRAYQNDPLNHDRITARLFNGVQQAGEWALAHAAGFPLPLLLLHGDADRITSAAATRAFAARAPNCTLRVWDDGYHEMHNDHDAPEMLTLIVDWLRARAAA